MSRQYLEQLARVMIDNGARSCTVQKVTGLTDVKCRDLYKEIRQAKSPSGQIPQDPTWHFKTNLRTFETALFLGFYKVCVKHFGDRGFAYVHAYNHFFMLAGSNRDASDLTPERADHARRRYQDSEDKDLQGTTMAPLKLIKCRKCKSMFVGPAVSTNNLCSDHVQGA